MRTKTLVLIFTCIFLTCCASSTQEKTLVPRERGKIKRTVVAYGSLSFDNLTYEELWEACEKTLIDRNYLFYIFDKQKGIMEFIRGGTTSSGAGISTLVSKRLSSFYYTFLISKKEGKVTLTYLVSELWSAKISFESGKFHVERLLTAVKKKLNK